MQNAKMGGHKSHSKQWGMAEPVGSKGVTRVQNPSMWRCNYSSAVNIKLTAKELPSMWQRGE